MNIIYKWGEEKSKWKIREKLPKDKKTAESKQIEVGYETKSKSDNTKEKRMKSEKVDKTND